MIALRLNFKQPRTQSFLGFCTVDGSNCLQCNNFQGLWNPPLEKSFGTSSIFYDRRFFRLADLTAAFAGVSHLRVLENACETFSCVIFVAHSLACISYCTH